MQESVVRVHVFCSWGKALGHGGTWGQEALFFVDLTDTQLGGRRSESG